VRILLDIDGVICRFAQTYLECLVVLTGRIHSEDEVTTWDFSKSVASPEEDAQVWHLIERPDVVSRLEEYPGAMVFLEALRTRGQVVAVTSPANTPRWCYERAQWLRDRRFTSRQIVFASDKALVRGDVLIDDHPDNVQAFVDAGGVGILLDRPWNRNAEGQNAFRAVDYAEVLYLVDRLAEYL
jgi:5'(3')-deoxyribonucleotidase